MKLIDKIKLVNNIRKIVNGRLVNDTRKIVKVG